MSTAQTPTVSVSNQQIGLALLVAYLMVYAVASNIMRRTAAFDITEPLIVLAILGVGFSLATWLLTIGIHPLDYPILNPKRELAVVAIYLLPVVAFATWGLDLLHRYVPTAPGNAIAILASKLLVFVAVPAAIMRAQFGYGLRQLV